MKLTKRPIYSITYNNGKQERTAKARTLIEALACLRSLNAYSKPTIYRKGNPINIEQCLEVVKWLVEDGELD